MTYKVVTPYVGYKADNGESHVIPKGQTVPDDVPAAQVKFWLKTGQVEQAASTDED